MLQCTGPIPIHEDNQGFISTANGDSNMNGQQMKHAYIQFHFIKEAVKTGQIELKYMPSRDRLADFLTKSVPKPVLTHGLTSLGVLQLGFCLLTKRKFQARIAEVDEDEQEKRIAFLAINSNRQLEALLANNMEKRTIIDSVASNHMFTNKNDFDTLENSTGAVQIGQEGVKIANEGKGPVTKNSNGRKIPFQNALYIPKLPYNPISLSQTWNKGGDLKQLAKNELTIEKINQSFFGGNIDTGLIHIKFNQTQAILSEHERLGHPGKEKEQEDGEPIDPVEEVPQQNEDRTADVPEIPQRDDIRDPLVIRLRITPVQNESVEEQQPDQDVQVVEGANNQNCPCLKWEMRTEAPK
ncbi:hypothetical protein O181_040032 [Austropuccinia psidii MF-1]|uniref:Retrovirus-related Pol polyprotein from transposon TNT 1-94-like beta-barrel domain-containing protein n=1 Tax=Austropuccinia psidii MF-1 TaxID=1389203 RepID=A0A9Q3DE15_9BASI|nr:hypothetical protein [Austropuccinia psidii MF-1]